MSANFRFNETRYPSFRNTTLEDKEKLYEVNSNKETQIQLQVNK